MKTFIRLDEKGTWRGRDHVSSVMGLAGEFDEETGRDSWEEGISCYELNAEGIAELYNYWINIASMNEKDAQRFQVTIFRGEVVGYGSDSEILASCSDTVKETDAISLYKKWMELDESYYEDDDTEASDVKEYVEEHAAEIMELLGV